MMATHTNSLKQSRAEIRRRICAMPVSRQQVRLMQKAIKELQQENALLRYILCIDMVQEYQAKKKRQLELKRLAHESS
jgi:hypothetical protein